VSVHEQFWTLRAFTYFHSCRSLCDVVNILAHTASTLTWLVNDGIRKYLVGRDSRIIEILPFRILPAGTEENHRNLSR
jgi:hypothetical protein